MCRKGHKNIMRNTQHTTRNSNNEEERGAEHVECSCVFGDVPRLLKYCNKNKILYFQLYECNMLASFNDRDRWQ